MPQRAPRPCSHPGCGRLTRGGRCDQHEAQAQARRRAQDEERGTAAQRGYGARWRRVRISYLKAHPLCRLCEQRGRVEPATVVDHITPHRGDMALFWDSDNWQPLCKPCHDAKTARGG